MFLEKKILDTLNSLALIINIDKEILYISPSVKEILGFEPNELLGENWWTKTKTDTNQVDIAKKRLSGFIFNEDSHEKRTFESTIKPKYGKVKYILWNISFLDNSNIIAIGNDITKRKEYEFLLHEKNKIIEQSQKEILSNLRYSQRIQNAILPDIDLIAKSVSEVFVLFKPKDIVSGDFYWFYANDNYKFIVAIDCTGHGISGAMLTTIGNALFREIIIRDNIFSPAEILHELDLRLLDSLNNNGHNFTIPDGMDVALCRINNLEKELCFAGAYRPLIVIDGGNNITEISPNRFPIGFYAELNKKFVDTTINFNETDSFYIFSDGYIDQFGGTNNKKMNKRRFKELLITINEMNFEERQSFLEYSLSNWQQKTEQTDDILVIGFKP